jgi:hypothetical protein
LYYIHVPVFQSGGGLQRLVSGVGYQLQINYMSVVSSVKSAPQTTFGLAKNGLGALLETVGSARDRVVNSISYYVMVSHSVIPAIPDLIWPLHALILSGLPFT